MKIVKQEFGNLSDGTVVHLYKMSNDTMEISITNFGCIMSSIKVPDRDQKLGEVVLGFDNLNDYLKSHPYFGAIVGPVANRISNAKYTYNGTEYLLNANEGINQLHGGEIAFDKVVWKELESYESEDFLRLKFTYLRESGMMGFPGNLVAVFTLTLYNSNRLDLNYYVTTDFETPVNLTHHEYFNLNDGGHTNCLDHLIQINADQYTPTNASNCVTGQTLTVEETPFDFRNFKSLENGIQALYGKVQAENGFDHNFILSEKSPIAASLKSNKSGRRLDIYTNKSCVQFYSGNYLDGTLGRADEKYGSFHGICLETQSFPDAVNQENFPSIILHPKETYDYFTSYVFSNF